MDQQERFKQALVRMIQSGTLQEMLGCQDGTSAKVEFHMARSFHIHLHRHHVVIHDRDTETIRRHRNKRWRRFRPTVHHRGRIVIERASGKILHAPLLGTIQTKPASPARHRARRTSARVSRLN